MSSKDWTTSLPSEFRALESELKTLIDGDNDGAKGFAAVREALGSAATLCIFGGLPRDVLRGRPALECSDIDVVVAGIRRAELLRRLDGLVSATTRYGGMRVRRGRWTVDVWCLADTWALREGHVKGGGFEVLPRTTFFTWDAIAVELARGMVHIHPDCRRHIAQEVLELNLEANANLPGNVLRAVRYLVEERVSWGPRLARCVHAFLADMRATQGMSLPQQYRGEFEASHVWGVFARLCEWKEQSALGETVFRLPDMAS